MKSSSIFLNIFQVLFKEYILAETSPYPDDLNLNALISWYDENHKEEWKKKYEESNVTVLIAILLFRWQNYLKKQKP